MKEWCSKVLRRSVVGKCCEGVLWRSVSQVTKCCQGVLWRSVVGKCFGEVVLVRSVVET